jgi:hypothetical protein
MTQATFQTVTTRVARLGWQELARQLDERRFAVTEPVLCAGECVALADLFDGDRFRSTIDMSRHRFGDGLNEGLRWRPHVESGGAECFAEASGWF